MTDAPKNQTTEDKDLDALLPLGQEFQNSVNYRIRMTQILAFRAFEKRLPGYGGAARYLGLLSIVRANPGQRQHRLADAVGLQSSSIVPILDQMEANGIIERRDIQGDRRSKAVFLTDQGEQVVAELSKPAMDMEQKTIAGFTEQEVQALIVGLDRIIDNLRQE
jgi:DNA-binding MarR family transcriptional regulator